MNRGVRRLRLFDSDADYEAFLGCAGEAQARIPIRVLAYCIMPNHFHFVLWPSDNDSQARFMHAMTGTHGKRWHRCRGTVGTGSVYQGRYKAFPVQTDSHFLAVCRYVERNPLRARLVTRAEDWRWSSLVDRTRRNPFIRLAEWPVPRPPDWSRLIEESEPTGELQRIRSSLKRGLPIGERLWTRDMTVQLGLESVERGRGRPKKTPGVFFIKK